MKRAGSWIAWLLVACALVGGVVGWRKYKANSEDGAMRFETAAVDRGPIVAKITATGALSALVTVQVGSQVSGRVHEILVDFNSPVKKGQVIARIDPQLFKAALEQAKANHAAASANLQRAQVQADDASRQHARTQALSDQKLLATADAETALATAQAAKAQVEAARAAVQQAAAQLHQAQLNLDYTTILSPIDGTVISRAVDVGQTVAASLQAPTLFVIAEDLRKMQVDASVSEADVGKLTPGMAAVFTVDAYPGDKFTGRVRQIRNAATTVQNVVTYDAVIDVANPELKLRPGMTASIGFVPARRDDALRVRNAALRFRPAPEMIAKLRVAGLPKEEAAAAARAGKGEHTRPPRPAAGDDDPTRRSVWVLRGKRPEQVSIKLGISDGTVTEVVDGKLEPGDEVITEATDPSAAKPGGAPRVRMF
jgi:HlyD family secretion protein